MASSTPHESPGRPPRRARPSRATIIRRRILALLILLALLALIAFGVTRLVQVIGGALAADPEPPPTVTESPTLAACALSDVSVVTRAHDLEVGEEGDVVVTLANTSADPCLLDTGREAMTFTVTSDSATVWDAGRCGEIPANRPLLLDADSSTELTMTWDGTVADAECAPERPEAGPGTYRYTVSLDGRLGDQSTVVVSAPPAAEDGSPVDGQTPGETAPQGTDGAEGTEGTDGTENTGNVGDTTDTGGAEGTTEGGAEDASAGSGEG